MVKVDTARYRESGQEVDIDDICKEVYLNLENKSPYHKVKEEIKSRNFMCLGCQLSLIAVSFMPDNKTSPHFRENGPSHGDECTANAYQVLYSSKTAGPFSKSNSFPAPYPNRLTLVDSKVISDTVDPVSEEDYKNKNIISDSQRLGAKNTSTHDRTVKTLKLIVKHFVRFSHPNDRNIALTVPGLDPSTYNKVFCRFKYREGARHDGLRIFYAPLMWSHSLLYESIQQNDIRLPIAEGPWINGKLREPIILSFSGSERSVSDFKTFERNLRTCLDDRSKSGTPWIFFLGTQTGQFKASLYEDDFRLIFCMNFKEGPKGKWNPRYLDLKSTKKPKSENEKVKASTGDNDSHANENQSTEAQGKKAGKLLEPPVNIESQKLPVESLSKPKPAKSKPTSGAQRKQPVKRHLTFLSRILGQ